MTIIPPFYLDSVVSIGVSVDNNEQPIFWVGTGFLVGIHDKKIKHGVYLVTNSHVINSEKEILLRFNRNKGQCARDYRVSLYDEKNEPVFSCHPNPNIDICACWLNASVLNSEGAEYSYFDLEKNSLTLAKMKETGVCEGSFIYSLGFPMNLVEDNRKSPICRLGCISRISDLFENANAYQYLVDAQVFPGNSGGPVLNRPEHVSIEGTPHNTSANLIGVLNAYIPYKETLISLQANEPRSIITENSGLALVYPVDYIKEVVMIEQKRISNQMIKTTKKKSK